MHRSRAVLVSATAFAGLALFSGCGAGSDTSRAGGGQTGGAGVVLNVAGLGSLGTVVTTADGHTLYRFDRDGANPSVSTCDGECARQWPPVLTDGGPLTVHGLDPSLVGTTTRADGSEQLTFEGRPLYRYAGDTEPGEAEGQGTRGAWFAASLPGTEETENPVGAESARSDGGNGGY